MSVRTWIGATSGDWSVTTNWVEGSVPVSGDDIYFANNAVSVMAGLNQSAVVPGFLSIAQTYTGTIGTASAYLQIGGCPTIIGLPSNNPNAQPTGSGRIKLNFGSSNAATVEVINTSTNPTDAGLEPVRIIGTNASNTLTVLGGLVGVATTFPEESSTFSVISGAGGLNSGITATVNIGSGVTLATLNASQSTINVACAMTTLNSAQNGVVNTLGSGTITTANVAGTLVVGSTGTITTLNVATGGTANFSLDPRGKTVTTCKVYSGAQINTNNGAPLSITFTNGILYAECGNSNVTANYGTNYTIKFS